VTKQPFYDEIEVGDEISPLVKHPTTRQLVKWAGVNEDFYELHYDKDFAQRRGFSGVIGHGPLGMCFLGQLLTDWVGTRAIIKKLDCKYKNVFYPGEDITARGTVTKKYIQNNEGYIECEIWLENPKGETVTSGEAVIVFPSKSS